MTKTELLDRCASNGEERLLLARVLDKLEQAHKRSIPGWTFFLSPGDRAVVEPMLAAWGHPPHAFFGGYEGAERTVCGFAPDWMEPDDLFSGEDSPVCALRIFFHESAKLGHRDFLGAILGLGLTREKLGDLLVQKDHCDLLVLRETAPIVLRQLTEVGRFPVKCAPIELYELEVRPPEVKVIRDTVATLRLDAVAASGFSTSRSKTADWIAGGRVTLNHREVTKPDRAVAQGDTVACKGLGKFILKEVSGLSKKGRVMLVIERYV